MVAEPKKAFKTLSNLESIFVLGQTKYRLSRQNERSTKIIKYFGLILFLVLIFTFLEVRYADLNDRLIAYHPFYLKFPFRLPLATPDVVF
jgi:hypothetical protein